MGEICSLIPSYVRILWLCLASILATTLWSIHTFYQLPAILNGGNRCYSHCCCLRGRLDRNGFCVRCRAVMLGLGQHLPEVTSNLTTGQIEVGDSLTVALQRSDHLVYIQLHPLDHIMDQPVVLSLGITATFHRRFHYCSTGQCCQRES